MAYHAFHKQYITAQKAPAKCSIFPIFALKILSWSQTIEEIIIHVGFIKNRMCKYGKQAELLLILKKFETKNRKTLFYASNCLFLYKNFILSFFYYCFL